MISDNPTTKNSRIPTYRQLYRNLKILTSLVPQNPKISRLYQIYHWTPALYINFNNQRTTKPCWQKFMCVLKNRSKEWTININQSLYF